MRITNKILTRFSILLLAAILYSCDRQRNMRGYDFVPDMEYSQAYETFSDNPNFKDSSTMRVPSNESVPRGYLPFRYTNDTLSRIKAGKELVNPFKSTPEVIEQGKVIYTTFCIDCHGKTGGGDGFLFKSGLYPLQPKVLSGAYGRSLKDGEIYHTITLGIRSMGSYGAQVRPDDRWKLVKYIRKLQDEALTRPDTASVKAK